MGQYPHLRTDELETRFELLAPDHKTCTERRMSGGGVLTSQERTLELNY